MKRKMINLIVRMIIKELERDNISSFDRTIRCPILHNSGIIR